MSIAQDIKATVDEHTQAIDAIIAKLQEKIGEDTVLTEAHQKMIADIARLKAAAGVQ